MIINQYVKDFEKLGFGLFVHFGLYSVLGEGEWSFHMNQSCRDVYDTLPSRFNPDPDWARELAKVAKAAGCKYINITTRHHDGFSLYDTCGLNCYDAPHSAAGRDLIREFVDACREEGLIPFFYHTLLDWHEESFNTNFPEYLKYLRKSVEILCTKYGKIGGLWFDGAWSKPGADWEEDALYSLIRKHQPEAMIINNTGLSARGELGHIELDSVTFERGRPQPINLEGSRKYVASEMCQIFGDHWGYARLDYNFKSLGDIIKDFCTCRRYKSNLLLNVGPMENGKLRILDSAMLKTLGEWITLSGEAFDGTEPSGITVSKESDFILKGKDAYYLFCDGLPRLADANVDLTTESAKSFYKDEFSLSEKITEVKWLESGIDVKFEQNGSEVKIMTAPQPYGQNLVVRIAKIITEK